ncbi:MAG: hypothetical protein ABIJ85_04220 [bacterium]
MTNKKTSERFKKREQKSATSVGMPLAERAKTQRIFNHKTRDFSPAKLRRDRNNKRTKKKGKRKKIQDKRAKTKDLRLPSTNLLLFQNPLGFLLIGYQI